MTRLARLPRLTARKRRLGPVPDLIQMLSADSDGSSIVVTYTAAISAGDFQPADFSTLPSDTQPDDVEQNDPTSLLLTFVGDVSADTSLEYTGTNAAGVLTPQTIAIALV
jgi:hypothetical protein